MELGLVRERRAQPLHHDELVESTETFRNREIDVGHAAVRELGDDAILSDRGQTAVHRVLEYIDAAAGVCDRSRSKFTQASRAPTFAHFSRRLSCGDSRWIY